MRKEQDPSKDHGSSTTTSKEIDMVQVLNQNSKSLLYKNDNDIKKQAYESSMGIHLEHR